MKGQLVKRQDRWDLYNESDGSKIASTLPNPMGKLSIKNCKAIENGYDLDELCEKYATNPMSNFAKNGDEYVAKHSFGRGFLKAMELMEGKKYNRQDVIHALTYGVSESKKKRTHSQILEEYRGTHLIEQTEWEVEIDMTEDWYDGFKSIPKLDKNGCLILKRI